MSDARVLLAFSGYALAAAAYLLLAVLTLASRRRRRTGGQLALAALATATWAAGSVGFAAGWAPARPVMAIFEVVHIPVWIGLLLHILDQRLAPDSPRPLVLSLLRWGIPALSLFYILAPASLSGSSLATVQLMFAITGIALVEQIYRGTRREDRWAIKYLCLGLGGLLLVEFYFYANGALFRALDPDIWSARGFVATLVAPLIAVSAARNPQWASPLAVSRSLAFYGTSLIGAGFYLLLISGAGYYLRAFGGEWGNIVLAVFLFAAALGGLVALSSGTLRARLKVFLSKHFFSYRYDYRKEWLKFTHALGDEQSTERLGERVVEAVAHLVESPAGALWLADETGWRRHAFWNWSAASGALPKDAPLAAWLVEQRWIIDLDEWRRRPEHYGDLDLPAWLTELEDAWLLVPLLHHDTLQGFVVLKHSLGKLVYDWEIGDLLKLAAQQASAHLMQMRDAEHLIVARQFESYSRATTFVVHDLKNLVAQLSLLLANAEKHRDNPEFQADMLETVASAVERMNKVLAQLRRDTDGSSQADVALGDILRDAIDSKRAFSVKPVLDLPSRPLQVRADRARLTRAIGHLVQNALEAVSSAGGRVRVSARADGEEAIIDIRDNGPGMDETFVRTRLFQPFDSTKGAGMGIGVYECRETVRALGGRIEVESAPGNGTRFTIALPLSTTQGAVR